MVVLLTNPSTEIADISKNTKKKIEALAIYLDNSKKWQPRKQKKKQRVRNWGQPKHTLEPCKLGTFQKEKEESAQSVSVCECAYFCGGNFSAQSMNVLLID